MKYVVVVVYVVVTGPKFSRKYKSCPDGAPDSLWGQDFESFFN